MSYDDLGMGDGGTWDDSPGETVYDWGWDLGGFEADVYEYHALAADGGAVEFEFVDPPTLSGDTITYSYKTKDRKTAQAGSVVAQIALIRDDNLIGGGTNKLKTELRPNDVGASSIRPANFSAEDGDYKINITISGDVRTVAYRMHGGAVSPA